MKQGPLCPNSIRLITLTLYFTASVHNDILLRIFCLKVLLRYFWIASPIFLRWRRLSKNFLLLSIIFFNNVRSHDSFDISHGKCSISLPRNIFVFASSRLDQLKKMICFICISFVLNLAIIRFHAYAIPNSYTVWLPNISTTTIWYGPYKMEFRCHMELYDSRHKIVF